MSTQSRIWTSISKLPSELSAPSPSELSAPSLSELSVPSLSELSAPSLSELSAPLWLSHLCLVCQHLMLYLSLSFYRAFYLSWTNSTSTSNSEATHKKRCCCVVMVLLQAISRVDMEHANVFVVMWQCHLCAQCVVIAIDIHVAVNLCVGI